ncbi:MAG: resolvase [Magnetococcales bacterium]|nr:resolvase [Magnetococcales bacterium]
MPYEKTKTINCAIYTRKSTDEGLEMDFNTLDAQREACEAYIASQRGEGWRAIKQKYDDGGFSGGSMERPALKRLMQDIKAGQVDIVVVYKIDRLTRSLIDFAKLVDVFDAHNVTFVSVTQSFNTTTSMGRLTLNVLLSFAQFEREVTGERIRDKIAASKKRGMWMGGVPPLGYKIVDRHLEVQQGEVAQVRNIFKTYLELGAVKELKKMLDKNGIKSPDRISANGNPYGGKPFSRGALYAMLKTPAYIGKVKHKSKVYQGTHEPIIDEATWHEVQNRLDENTQIRTGRLESLYLLRGLLFDVDGTPYSPTHTKKGSLKYRYYISQNLLQFKEHPKGLIARLPAGEVEEVIIINLRKYLARVLAQQVDGASQYLSQNMDKLEGAALVRGLVTRINVGPEEMVLNLDGSRLSEIVRSSLDLTLSGQIQLDKHLTIPYVVKQGRNGSLIINPESKELELFDMPKDELKRLVQGVVWRDRHFNGETLTAIAEDENYSESYVRHSINKSFDTLTKYFQ